MGRVKIAAGNWKMNKTAKEAVEFVQALKDKVAGADAEVVTGCLSYAFHQLKSC